MGICTRVLERQDHVHVKRMCQDTRWSLLLSCHDIILNNWQICQQDEHSSSAYYGLEVLYKLPGENLFFPDCSFSWTYLTRKSREKMGLDHWLRH